MVQLRQLGIEIGSDFPITKEWQGQTSSPLDPKARLLRKIMTPLLPSKGCLPFHNYLSSPQGVAGAGDAVLNLSPTICVLSLVG